MTARHVATLYWILAKNFVLASLPALAGDLLHGDASIMAATCPALIAAIIASTMSLSVRSKPFKMPMETLAQPSFSAVLPTIHVPANRSSRIGLPLATNLVHNPCYIPPCRESDLSATTVSEDSESSSLITHVITPGKPIYLRPVIRGYPTHVKLHL